MTFRERFKELSDNEDLFYDLSQKAAQILTADMHLTLAEQTNLYREWALYANLADAEEKASKVFLEKTVLPTQRLAARKIASDRGIAKPTKQDLEDVAFLSDEYRIAQQNHLRAQEVAGRFRAVERSMAQRAEIVRSINSRQCKEMG